MGQQDTHVDISYRNFQPSYMDLQAITCTHKLISRSGNAFCNLFSYSSKDSVVTEKPKISDIEDSEENAHIFYDVLYCQDEYSIPIQIWIKNVVKCWLWSLIIFLIQRSFTFSRVYTP
jgi:hypothetical protein